MHLYTAFLRSAQPNDICFILYFRSEDKLLLETCREKGASPETCKLVSSQLQGRTVKEVCGDISSQQIHQGPLLLAWINLKHNTDK